MTIAFKPLIAAGSLLVLSACATLEPRTGFDEVERSVEARTGHSVAWRTGAAADAEVAANIDTLLGRPLGEADVLQIALLNNPGLQAKYEMLGVAQADLVQAGLLKNPVFDGAIRFSGGERPAIDLDLTQDFLSLFTLPLRRRLAGYDYEIAKLGLTADLVDFVAGVRAAYFNALTSYRAVDLLADILETGSASLAFADALHQAGNITQLALDRERAAYEETRLLLADAERALVRDREALTVLMGLWGDKAGWSLAAVPLDLPEGDPLPADIEAKVVAESLQLAESRTRIEALAARLGLADVEALLPDFDLGYSGERADGWEHGLGLGITLPIFDTGKARRFGLTSSFRAEQWHYVERAVAARSAAREAAAAAEQTRRAAEHIRTVLLPLMARIGAGSMREYNAMQVGTFQLLNDRRRRVETGLRYGMAVRDYWQARTRLDQLLAGGRPDTRPVAPATLAAPQSQAEAEGH